MAAVSVLSRLLLHAINQGFFKDQFRTAQSSNSMASAEREPITGVWGWGGAPSGGPGAEPPVGGQGDEAPLKLNAFLFCVSKGSCKFSPLLISAKVSKSHSE